MTDVAAGRERPAAIKAVPVRHPGRWASIVVLAVLAAMFVHMLVTNKNFEWQFIWDNAFNGPVLEGVRATITVMIASMVIGIGLGVVIAVMRLSANPVLSGAAWLYTWFFRAVPRLVLCILCGNLGILYSRYEFGVPFDHQLGFDGRFFGFTARDILAGLVAGTIALGLSEAAYMAEIVRAGIQSVDPGQLEAAQALGMSRGKALRRIVLPQAMRVIIPPTGNEAIAMLKDTSLLAVVPASELFFQLTAISNRTFRVFPMLVAACLWYLALTSVFMVGQYFLERYFSKGSAQHRALIQLETLAGGTGGGGV
jgi:polar amino acid transport system permease protein